MNNQRELEHIFVKELRKENALKDVILSYALNTVRICEYCHKLMNEGWMFEGHETYCSDKCLRGAYPDINLKLLKSESPNNWDNTYWTDWK